MGGSLQRFCNALEALCWYSSNWSLFSLDDQLPKPGVRTFMRNIPVPIQLPVALDKLWRAPTVTDEQTTTQNKQMVLVGLMVPFVMVIFNMSVFEVTLPTIRDVFQIKADIAAWIMTAYTLPFMISMPLYGRLGDALGRRRLFLAGMVVFLLGTLITLSAVNLAWFILGRAVQGLGSAGVVPLSMAIIAQLFPVNERGKAMGTWNSIGPVTNITAPLLSGFLIDYLNWRIVFGPVLLVTLIAMGVVWRRVPPKQEPVARDVLRTFDWGGVLLLAAAATTLMFYLSSQTITGVATLQDWRLLLLTLAGFVVFIIWEKRQPRPYIDLTIFSHKIFSLASTCAALRMFVMNGVGFIVPLYLADVYHLSAASTGLMLMTHAGALLLTMRLGGQWADRWHSRSPVAIGLTLQFSVMVGFALAPATSPLWLLAVGLMIHGVSAGLSLAPLHRAAVGKTPAEQAGIAAGLYSMVRFCGTMLGPALGGVALQHGLNQALLPVAAYQAVFWLIAGTALLGMIVSWGLRD
jgi:EmrB/QacA subfamily drug resistance transporter